MTDLVSQARLERERELCECDSQEEGHVTLS